MANKKKKETIIPEIVDKKAAEDEDYDDYTDYDEDTIDNALEIGGQIHVQAPIITDNFKHLPKDVKYSRFGKIDLATFTLKSSTYQLWKYIRKIQAISKNELTTIKEKRIKLYDVTTKEEFKEYLESIGKGYIWYSFKELEKAEFEEKFKLMLAQLKHAKDEGIVTLLYTDKDNFYGAYNSYVTDKGDTEGIDDFGLMNSMMTLTEVKKAHIGWAMKMMNTTINVTKDETPGEDQEEEPEERETQSKGFFKK